MSVRTEKELIDYLSMVRKQMARVRSVKATSQQDAQQIGVLAMGLDIQINMLEWMLGNENPDVERQRKDFKDE